MPEDREPVELRPVGDGNGGPDEFVTEIRANRDFEHLVVATVYGAGVCAALRFVGPLLADTFAGRHFIPAFASHGFSALLYGALIFLTGFALSIIVGFPLARRFVRKGGFNIGVFFAIGFVSAGLSLIALTPATSWHMALRLAPAVIIPTLFWRERRRVRAPLQ